MSTETNHIQIAESLGSESTTTIQESTSTSDHQSDGLSQQSDTSTATSLRTPSARSVTQPVIALASEIDATSQTSMSTATTVSIPNSDSNRSMESKPSEASSTFSLELDHSLRASLPGLSSKNKAQFDHSSYNMLDHYFASIESQPDENKLCKSNSNLAQTNSFSAADHSQPINNSVRRRPRRNGFFQSKTSRDRCFAADGASQCSTYDTSNSVSESGSSNTSVAQNGDSGSKRPSSKL